MEQRALTHRDTMIGQAAERRQTFAAQQSRIVAIAQ
jgi:hypothetical protein